jgi:amino acid transporter
MMPFIFAITFFILLTLVFSIIPGLFLCVRWFSMINSDDDDFTIGDMRVPTFYSADSDGDEVAFVFCMPFVGVIFGGIHCVGWFFDFPSSVEAMLWRVSSAVLTGIAFLFPIFLAFIGFFFDFLNSRSHTPWRFFSVVFSIILQVYVVSRLILLVEAFISLRHLTPEMLALVKWTSFIPHI